MPRPLSTLSAVLAALTLTSQPSFAINLGITHLEVPPTRALLDGKPIPHGDDYAFIDDFSEGLALAYRFTKDDRIIKQYLDLEGRAVIDDLPFHEQEFLPADITREADPYPNQDRLAFREGLAVYGVERPKEQMIAAPWYGYIDRTGKTAIAPAFTLATPFHQGVALVVQLDDSQAIIDGTGKVLHTFDKEDFAACPFAWWRKGLFDSFYNKDCAIPLSWTRDAEKKKVTVLFRKFDENRREKDRKTTVKIPDFTETAFPRGETVDVARVTRTFGRPITDAEKAALEELKVARAKADAADMKRREQMAARMHVGNPAKPKRFIVGQLYGETRGGSVSVTREVDRGLTYSKTETKTIDTSTTRSFLLWRYVTAFDGSSFTLLSRYAPVQDVSNRPSIPSDLHGLPGVTVVGEGPIDAFLKAKGVTLGNREESPTTLTEDQILSMTDLPFGKF